MFLSSKTPQRDMPKCITLAVLSRRAGNNNKCLTLAVLCRRAGNNNKCITLAVLCRRAGNNNNVIWPNSKLRGRSMIVYAAASYQLLGVRSLFATASWQLPLPRLSVTFFVIISIVSTATHVTSNSSLTNNSQHCNTSDIE